MKDIPTYRRRLGAALKQERERKSISKYHLEKHHGLRYDTTNAIERGEGYTMDSFLAYVIGTDAFLVINKDFFDLFTEQ